MEMCARNRPPHLAAATLFLIAVLHHLSAVRSIGVNYGTLGNNLPHPAQVAQFVKQKATIDRIKIFDPNPEILRAFANTGILVAVTVPNLEIPSLTNVQYARRWVDNNIKPFHPQTKINYVLVGNEVLHAGLKNLTDNLVAAMKSLHEALLQRLYCKISMLILYVSILNFFRENCDENILN
ncbi:glucan endo-1,3-beta-glucosidase-like [Primulina tabacum]|uniref:glucan endo-1,3-beta-glucosidase-like n=1 Tax=Primulina tabacum TaxID=48773 RepID=UPI003F5AC80F